jgi:oxygen-independent coproporphyrinogen-3 oxidase
MMQSPHAGALSPAIEFDAQLTGRLGQPGPRYTSYPTADRFSESFGYGDYLQTVAAVRRIDRGQALSLYLHIPFCESLCYYCACNKIVTRDHGKAATYLAYLKREIEMQGHLFAGSRQVEQLHLGGGTPTFLSDAQLDDLMRHVRRWFKLADDEVGEFSIEIDPRTVDRERIFSLRRQGFNRLSMGVQDFDPDVQKAVNRIQPEHLTRSAMQAAREAGFRSISIDLIYGLPGQNPISMGATLAKVIEADPDRISIYNYAHMPQLFKAQRQIADELLPDAQSKLDMLALCIKRLTRAGYVYIGMDHFAKPGDELAIAQAQGRLHRNFQGYSTHAHADLVACGVSAISAVGSTYSQNVKTLAAYYRQLDAGQLPVARGIRLSMDDMLRRTIIQKLMCNFELSILALERTFPISFAKHFKDELEQVRGFERDGLLAIDAQWITVTPKGRYLIRNICMVFDRYLQQRKCGAQSQTVPLRYSKTI